MAKGYDPNKYVADLTKSAEGIADTVKKIDERIETASKTAKTKADAAKVAADKVTALKAEKDQVEQNGRQVANLIATAKGEPVPFPPDEPQDVTDLESEPAVV